MSEEKTELKKYRLLFNDGMVIERAEARNEEEAMEMFVDSIYDQWNDYCKTKNSKGEDITRDRSEPEIYSRERVRNALLSDYYIESDESSFYLFLSR